MKKITNLFIISIFMLIAFGGFNSIISQPPPPANCEQCTGSWTSTYETIIVNSCPVLIEYEFRTCEIGGDYNVDLRLVSITKPTGTCFATQDELIEEASRKMLASTHKYRDDFSPPGDINALLTVPDCMNKTSGSGDDVFAACLTSGVCCKQYEIDYLGKQVSDIIAEKTYTIICSPTGGCEESCDKLGQIDEDPYIYSPQDICTDSCGTAYESQGFEYVDGSCTLYISYQKRTNCEGDLEIFLDNITTEGSCSSYSTSSAVIKKAIQKILKRESTTTSQDISLKLIKCWESQTVGDKEFWLHCEYLSCCTVEYTSVVYNSMTEISTYSSSNITTTPYNDCSVISCTYICNGTHLSPSNPLKPTFEIEERTFNTFTNVIPNPANGLTKFILESPDEGQITLKIFNDLGQDIFQKVFDKQGYHQELTIDLAKFNTGSFRYVFEFNGKHIANGSFIVTK